MTAKLPSVMPLREEEKVVEGQVEIAYDDSIIVMSVEIKALWDEWIRRESK